MVLAVYAVILSSVTVAVPASAASLKPRNMRGIWYNLAVFGYRDQLKKGYTWDWSQVNDTTLHHETLISYCLKKANYPLTQFLFDMGDPNPYPPMMR